MFSTLNWLALRWALAASGLLVLAVLVGSRELQNFDGALVAYLFGTLFATFGIVYRYAVWLQRPPTRLLWRRGWQFLFSRRFLGHALELLRRAVADIGGQAFVFARNRTRGLAHVLIAWGCLSAFAITLPLTFGWIHFTLAPGSTSIYQAHVFGFTALSFPHHGLLAQGLFHALNVSSVMVILGAAYFIHRRMTDGGQIATQSFEIDWLPLVLLILIAVTGLGLWWDYAFMQGRAHAFMATAHAISVVLLLVWLPFGKFFHVFQRPAQLGVALYQREGAAGAQATCADSGLPFASALHVADIKALTRAAGAQLDLAAGGSHLDLSPRGKRAALARAHLAARERAGSLFG